MPVLSGYLGDLDWRFAGVPWFLAHEKPSSKPPGSDRRTPEARFLNRDSRHADPQLECTGQ